MIPSTTLPSSGLGGPLYHKDQMPEHFHEHFIVTGYRHPKSSAWQCILSLFDATNETLNFWTHFLPSWYFMWVLKGLSETLDFQHDPYTWPLLCYMFACCMFPLASAIAHTFNVMSERARHVCFFLDYSALSLFSFGVAVSYRAYCFPEVLKESVFYPWYVFGAGCCAVVCTLSSCGTRFMRPSAVRQCLRLFSFSLPYLFNSFPVIVRLLFCSEEESRLTAQTLHARQFIFAVIAAFLYASHFPERLKPGQFDIIGHSHQLFHVATILGVMDQLQAVLQDMQERRALVSSWMDFDLHTSLGLMGLVLVVNTVIITVYSLYLYLAKNLHLLPPSHTAAATAATDSKCKCS
ncbi:membrane progestin receptor gamma-like [Babylonia areolata]|uniref:membrane progestin receptor gamma-like n=1 Tax=Babylonia areolata TaxID=304850 RepID=UPI003FD27F6A